jgi:hypothetical protein
MKKLIKTLVAGFVVVMVLAASASALDTEQKGVVGSWTLSAEGYVLEMVLAQNGKKITGTLQGPHGPMPLKGQFAKGRLTFSGEGPDGIGGREKFSATAVLQPDGALVGALTSTTSGNLTWRAVRTAGR